MQMNEPHPRFTESEAPARTQPPGFEKAERFENHWHKTFDVCIMDNELSKPHV